MIVDPNWISDLESLSDEDRRRVMQYARTLPSFPRKSSIADVYRAFVGTIPPEDLSAMQSAVESACEQVDSDAW